MAGITTSPAWVGALSLPCANHGDCASLPVPFCYLATASCLDPSNITACVANSFCEDGMYCRAAPEELPINVTGAGGRVCQSGCPVRANDTEGLSDSEVLLLVAVSSIMVVAFVTIVAAMCGKRRIARAQDSNTWIIFSIAFAIADIVSDVAFVSSLAGTWSVLGWSFLVIPAVVNMICVSLFWVREVRSGADDMVAYNRLYHGAAAAVMMISFLNLECLSLLTSNVFGMLAFKAPLSKRGRRFLKYGRLVNVFLEDIPQILLAVIVTRRCFGFNVVAIASVFFSTVAILFTLASRGIIICSYYLREGSEEFDVNDAQTLMGVLTHEYDLPSVSAETTTSSASFAPSSSIASDDSVSVSSVSSELSEEMAVKRHWWQRFGSGKAKGVGSGGGGIGGGSGGSGGASKGADPALASSAPSIPSTSTCSSTASSSLSAIAEPTGASSAASGGVSAASPHKAVPSPASSSEAANSTGSS